MARLSKLKISYFSIMASTKIASLPPLSADIEWLFSSTGAAVHTKLRNRLGSDKVTKLVHVAILYSYRHLGGREKTRKMTTLGETSEGEKQKTSKNLSFGGRKPFKLIPHS